MSQRRKAPTGWRAVWFRQRRIILLLLLVVAVVTGVLVSAGLGALLGLVALGLAALGDAAPAENGPQSPPSVPPYGGF